MIELKVYDRYIIKQILKSTFVCILLFTVVWIAPEILFKVIQRVLNGMYTPLMGAQLLLFEIPKVLGKALPVGLLLGSLYSFDKYSKDSELTIFRCVGLSFWRIIAPVIAVSIVFTFICFFINDKIIAYSSSMIRTIKNEAEETHFVYTETDPQNKPIKTIIVSNYNDKKGMKDITVLNFSPEFYTDAALLSEIIIGEYIKVDGDTWNLIKGKKYKLTRDGIFNGVDEINKMEVLKGLKATRAFTLLNYSLKKDTEFNNNQMKYYMKLLKEENMTDESHVIKNKYLQRYFHSIVCIFFAIFGCILGFSKPREQKLIGFTIAIGVIFLYYITLPFVDLLAEKGVLSPWITSSIQPIVMFFAILLFKKLKDL